MGLYLNAWRCLSCFSALVPLFLLGLTCILANLSDVVPEMSAQERAELKEEAREMFYHAYRSYMDNAYPADELMPLSCSGRWRKSEYSRGDIDDALGNFSLTLIDTLDTLVVLGDVKEFERAAKLVIKDVSFDSDIIVSVFETNIRVLGGLLSAHVLAEHIQQQGLGMAWYRGELLSMAKDVGYILLPAFNSSTGIPYPRVNLRYGLKSHGLASTLETCTACAGTMILEFAALSRLSGEPIFEEKAHHAMDELWRLRHRNSDLMGTVLNIHSGDWVRRDSGVGAGIDSYYEYCLKAYILLGDDRYLGRFNKHYTAVMKYISQGPMLLDVLMHRPHLNSRNFMDALLAFWPGLQVLKGDIQPAVETHEMLYQVLQRHNFIPEAFTTDFQVHWAQAPLRPEFLESTYFLHKATGDPYYLEVGRSVLRSLQKYARVSCGFAAVKDVRTNIHEDRMDSFVLAETLKYLFLLFADPSDLLIDLDQFVFTTEAHLLPLTLARAPSTPAATNSTSKANISAIETVDAVDYTDILVNSSTDGRTCPNNKHLFLSKIRLHLRNLVDGTCRKEVRRKLRASEFQIGNPEHLALLEEMGIKIMSLEDGRMQLLHALATAANSKSAEEGILFMQEMVELSKLHSKPQDIKRQAVIVQAKSGTTIIKGGPAHFGRQLKDASVKVTGRVQVASPFQGCSELAHPEKLKGSIVILERGSCMFVDKARRIMEAGAIGGIVVDNVVGSSSEKSPFFAMSGDGSNDVTIPMVFLFYEEAITLLKAVWEDPTAAVTLSCLLPAQEEEEAKERSKDSALDKLRETIIQFLSSDSGKTKTSNPQRSAQQDSKAVSGGVEEKAFSMHELLKGVALQWDSQESASESGKADAASETEKQGAPEVPSPEAEATSCSEGECDEAGGASPAVLVEPPRQRLNEPVDTYLKNSGKDEL